MSLSTSSVTLVAGEESLPSSTYAGNKTNIGSTHAPLTTVDSPLLKGVLVRIVSLGGGTFIKFGDLTNAEYIQFKTVDSFVFIDWVDNLNKIYVISDGTNAKVEWYGG